jgi:hypothetical protein
LRLSFAIIAKSRDRRIERKLLEQYGARNSKTVYEGVKRTIRRAEIEGNVSSTDSLFTEPPYLIGKHRGRGDSFGWYAQFIAPRVKGSYLRAGGEARAG